MYQDVSSVGVAAYLSYHITAKRTDDGSGEERAGEAGERVAAYVLLRKRQQQKRKNKFKSCFVLY